MLAVGIADKGGTLNGVYRTTSSVISPSQNTWPKSRLRHVFAV